MFISNCANVIKMTPNWFAVFALIFWPFVAICLYRLRPVGQATLWTILGAQLLGAGAAETIHVFALAMEVGMTAERFKHLVFAYPTFASALGSTLP